MAFVKQVVTHVRQTGDSIVGWDIIGLPTAGEAVASSMNRANTRVG
jgi:hypothetical protein